MVVHVPQSMVAAVMVAAGDNNVYRAFAGRFADDPGRVFIRSADGRVVRYGDVPAMTGGMAAALAQRGVRKGDRVAGVLEKSPEGLLLYLAVSRLGALYVPVNTGLTVAEIDYILDDARPAALVCDPAYASRLNMADMAVFTLDALGQGSLADAMRDADRHPEPMACTGHDANALVYTSGTTGKPKGAVITNGLVIWNALALAARWQVTPDDVLLHANPMAFSLFATTLPVLAGGGALRLVPRFDADDVMAALPGVTLFAGVPTYYTRLLAREDFGADTCRHMRLFICGSAPLRADVFARFHARTGHVLLDRYGLTESLIVASNAADGERLPDRSGPPLDGSSIRVVDESGHAVSPGTVGSIESMQPFLFQGYWGDAAKSRAAFTDDGWFITGDFGRLDAQGNVTVLGRGVDLIITGGLNVYPKEIENHLHAVDNVLESAVIGVPHADFGEAVVGVVELRDAGLGLDVPAVLASLKTQMAGYKVPKRIEVVPSLPRNTLGKIQKALLKKQFA